MDITVKSLKDALKRTDAPLFKGELNVNFIGIRSADKNSNAFNDVFAVLYQKNSRWCLVTFNCTTDPGLYYRKNPLNILGTAILKPGHYGQCWAIGSYRGQYKALVQRKPMTVYRDDDKNRVLDKGNEETGVFGINCHRARRCGYSLQVDKWSAGCQVLSHADAFKQLMDLAEQSAEIYGNGFSYTLLTEADLNE